MWPWFDKANTETDMVNKPISPFGTVPYVWAILFFETIFYLGTVLSSEAVLFLGAVPLVELSVTLG